MLNYIDLFAGAGGLSEGFTKAGFNPIAHVEMDINACLTLRTRIAYHYLKSQNQLGIYYSYLKQEISRDELYNRVPPDLLKSVIQTEISDLSINSIFNRIDKFLSDRRVNLIVGGPPCQAYSLVGRSKINSLDNQNVITDVRYELYKQYGRFLQKYQPEYFVFENVIGIMSAEKRQLIPRIQQYFEKECGYKINLRVVKAYDHGVLQRRLRVIIVGRKGNAALPYPDFKRVKRQEDWSVMNSLLADLEPLRAGEQKHVSKYVTPEPNDYQEAIGIRNEIDFVTQHITRPHNERDLKIYKLAIEKWKQGQRLKYNDVPEELRTHKNLTAFLDRYKVVDPNGLSHTVVAHLSKDGHYYIYPDEHNPRSLSVREAARIQSFPDDYYFEGGKGAAFRQIGNAVPPQLAFVIAEKMKELFSEPLVHESSLHDYPTRRAKPVGTH